MDADIKHCEDCIWFTHYDIDSVGYCRNHRFRAYGQSLPCDQFADEDDVW